MILGGGRDEKERGWEGERRESWWSSPLSGGTREEPGLGRAVGCTPRDVLGCAGSSIEEAVVEGICPACVPIFPTSAPNCPALPLTVPSLPLLPSAWENPVRINKSSRLLRDKGGEGWRRFGGLIFPSCAIIWWQDLFLLSGAFISISS